jgi:hypothetical protein
MRRSGMPTRSRTCTDGGSCKRIRGCIDVQPHVQAVRSGTKTKLHPILTEILPSSSEA